MTTNNVIFKRVLRRFDLTLFSVCAIIVLDGLGASAAIGVSSLAWYVITFILFFIPYGLITAELGTAYSGEGGLFLWIWSAFGDRWAARCTWCYWVCVPLGMPSVFVLFAGIFARLFLPEMSLFWIVVTAILMTWLTVLTSILRLEVGKWVPNLGALFKASIILVMGIGGVVFAIRHGPANDLSLKAMLPTWNAGLAFLPVIVFNFLGFELMSGAGEEMKNPGRDIPPAIFVSGGLIAFFYLFATLGILFTLPLQGISLIKGIIDALTAVLGNSGFGRLTVSILGIAALYTFFATMVTWTLGANRMAAQAARRGTLPGIFSRRHPVHETPLGASLLTGTISTVVLVVYGALAGNNETLFWSLFAFASMVFLLPYLLLFPAFLKLRHSDPEALRPYRFPGGPVLAWIAAFVCLLFILQAIVFFVWVPGLPVDWSFTLPVLVGVGITLIAGEFLIRKR